jgi:hypothetical protein
MEGIGIRLGINGNGAQSHFSAGADNADGDFAAVGNEE